jgi:tellurite resistance protein
MLAAMHPTHEGRHMFNRWKTLAALLAAAAVTALAVGGVASATKGGTVHRKAAHHAVKHASRASETATGLDTDNIQSGDQTAPDSVKATGAATSESSTETASESSPGDGPGGHEDPAGAEEDHQFEGVE